MELTPLEIQKKEFKKVFRGFCEDEVRDYLDKISRQYENTYRENQELKEQLNYYKESLKQYKNMEETLKDAIVMAQKTAEDVKENTKREKQLIIKKAMAQATKLLDAAKREQSEIKKQSAELRKQFLLYKTRFLNFIQAQYDLINSFELSIDAENSFLIANTEVAASEEETDVNILNSQEKESFIEEPEETDTDLDTKVEERINENNNQDNDEETAKIK